MRSAYRLVWLVVLLCLFPLISSADVLVLKSGETITGKFQGADLAWVSFSVSGQARRYAISEINSITFTTNSAQPAAAPPEPSTPPGRPTLSRRNEAPSRNEPPYRNEPPSSRESSGTLSPSPSADGDNPRPISRSSASPRPMNVTVHAGTIVTVRMIDRVDSGTDDIGQTYRASLDEPLIVDGETVAPRGADVTAKLTSKQEAGRISGRSELSLVLMDITLQGRKYEISTSEVTESGASRGRQTATRAGAGAAIGAVIGAIAGGGKGAAIGAATGAGAGTAIQIATHGEQVNIPSETRLDFTLSQPLNL